MKSLIFFATLYTFICCSHCFTTLPSYLKSCSRSDPKLHDCIVKNGIEAIPFLVKGDPMYHIPSFDPLKIDKVNLEASDNIKLYGTNISIIGLNLITLKDINWEIEKKFVTVQVFTPLLRVLGTYHMNGHILVLNLIGSGAMNNSHYDNDINASIKYGLYKKNETDYIKIEKVDINIVFKSVHLYFENILNNPTLSKQINEILNENSKILISELFISMKQIIEDVVMSIANPIADNIPFDNIIRP